MNFQIYSCDSFHCTFFIIFPNATEKFHCVTEINSLFFLHDTNLIKSFAVFIFANKSESFFFLFFVLQEMDRRKKYCPILTVMTCINIRSKRKITEFPLRKVLWQWILLLLRLKTEIIKLRFKETKTVGLNFQQWGCS